MNRFIIEHHPDAIAKSLCDQHIVKMPLEEAQMLCTSLWHHAPFYAEAWDLYKPVHQKHPCTLWAMETRANFKYAYELYCSMLCEYHERYGKWHGAGKHSQAIAGGIDLIPDGQLTPYRAFYKVDKTAFARYNKGRNMPEWMKENCNEQ
jgi:hypothetical protein